MAPALPKPKSRDLIRATAGEDVHLLEQAEGVDGPQQGAQGQAALDVGQGDVPELLEEAGAVDAGGLILVLRHGLEGGVQQQKHKGDVLPHVDQQDRAEGRFCVHEPVEHRQAQSLQELVDDAVVGGEHHPPAEGHRDGGQQIGQEQQRPHNLLPSLEGVDKYCDQKAEGHLQYHRQDSELDGVPHRLLKISVFKEGDVVIEQHKRGVLRALQVVVVGKAVYKCENQGIGRHDQQDYQGGREHSDPEPVCGRLGAIQFCNLVSLHTLASQTREVWPQGPAPGLLEQRPGRQTAVSFLFQRGWAQAISCSSCSWA